jgi:uncharacterized RDD family membrane protein YckC
VIDAIGSFFFLGLPVTLAFGDKTTTSDGSTWWSMTSGGFAIWVVLTLLYFVTFETLFGASVGKLVLGLRVRHEDGSPIELGPALWRNLLRPVDCFPYFIPYLLGAFFIWAGSDRQRLGDRVAGTIVTWRD